jgi:hypothetical protein
MQEITSLFLCLCCPESSLFLNAKIRPLPSSNRYALQSLSDVSADRKKATLNAKNHSMGMSVQRRCSKNSLPGTEKKKKQLSRLRRSQLMGPMGPSESHLTGLFGLSGHALLTTCLADLIGTDPLALNRPGTEALVVRVVASKVAVFYQTTTRVSAREVNDFILAVCQRAPEREMFVLEGTSVPGT